EPVEVHRGAHGPADQALDFLRAAVNFSFRYVPLFALLGGVGEHGILGRNPAAGDVLFLHPSWDRLLDHHPADDAGLPPFNQRRSGGMGRDVIVEPDPPQLVWTPPVGTDGRETGGNLNIGLAHLFGHTVARRYQKNRRTHYNL